GQTWRVAPALRLYEPVGPGAGPTGFGAGRRFTRSVPELRACGAGFIPADGGGHNTVARVLSPLAGIKPAPQGSVLAAGSRVPRRSCEPVGPGSSRPTGVGTTPWRGP